MYNNNYVQGGLTKLIQFECAIGKAKVDELISKLISAFFFHRSWEVAILH